MDGYDKLRAPGKGQRLDTRQESAGCLGVILPNALRLTERKAIGHSDRIGSPIFGEISPISSAINLAKIAPAWNEDIPLNGCSSGIIDQAPLSYGGA